MQELIKCAQKTFEDFSIRANKYLNIISFAKYFLDNIGDEKRILIDEIYDEIINSNESLGNIFDKKGFLDWLQSFFSNYKYLWNIFDMLTNTYLEKINKKINLLENKFIDYIIYIKKHINISSKVSIRKFSEAQLKAFKELKAFYEEEKNEINKIKQIFVKIYDLILYYH